MLDQLHSIFAEISLSHLSILFLLGLALFGGTVGGKIFQKIRIPQVVGYIIVGILIGQTGAKFIDKHTVDMLRPFNYFALGLIGFMIGGELKKETFKKYGKQFIYILSFEGITAFIAVSTFVIIVGSFFFENTKLAWALGLLLGSIASATAPAATTDVLWEYKTRGPLTTTVLGIVALDDGLALLLFAFASSIAGILVGNTNGGILNALFVPLYEIGGSISIGILSGFILSKILKKCNEEDKILAFTIGTVLLVLGISVIINVDILLAAMGLGVMITNYNPRKSKEAFKLVEKFTPPIYVLFFVLFGAKLNLNRITLFVGILAFVYLIGRTAGKMFGANLGARISGAEISIQKYLPLCLFSQAGVAIGLSILVGHRFPGEIGNATLVIITTTTFIVQIIGPPFVKLAVVKAKEVGLNITEDDLIKKTLVKDIMDKDIPLIYEHMALGEILRIFSRHKNLFYPVVDSRKRLTGIITIDNIKNTFVTSGLDKFLVAQDLIEPVIAVVTPETPMSDVKNLLEKNHLEYLPVVSNGNKVVGFLESREITRLISRKIGELHRGKK